MTENYYQTILDIIPLGSENGVSQSELAMITHIPTGLIRRIISEARSRGVIIISDSNGYYIPVKNKTDYGRLWDYFSGLHRRGSRLYDVLKAPVIKWILEYEKEGSHDD